jgi:hypothetical protein
MPVARPVPNVQVGPNPGQWTGNYFTYCTGDGLIRDVNMPGEWIQIFTGDSDEWSLGTPGGPFLSVNVDELTGQISIRGTRVTNFFVCNDESTRGLGVKLRFYDFVLTTDPQFLGRRLLLSQSVLHQPSRVK